MSRIHRIGLSWEPPDGWPLDHLLVGVATLRTLRELVRGRSRGRAWDLSLRTGVTAQGSADSLARMERLGFVYTVPADPSSAPRYVLDRSHELHTPLAELFAAERELVKSAWPERRRP